MPSADDAAKGCGRAPVSAYSDSLSCVYPSFCSPNPPPARSCSLLLTPYAPRELSGRPVPGKTLPVSPDDPMQLLDYCCKRNLIITNFLQQPPSPPSPVAWGVVLFSESAFQKKVSRLHFVITLFTTCLIEGSVCAPVILPALPARLFSIGQAGLFVGCKWI